jgi:hypothetical protein
VRNIYCKELGLEEQHNKLKHLQTWVFKKLLTTLLIIKNCLIHLRLRKTIMTKTSFDLRLQLSEMRFVLHGKVAMKK